MKPVRVIHELSTTEQFIRATERATEIRDAARARLDADFVERIEEARSRYLVTDRSSDSNGAPNQQPNGAHEGTTIS
jgi:hypothetical protein